MVGISEENYRKLHLDQMEQLKEFIHNPKPHPLLSSEKKKVYYLPRTSSVELIDLHNMPNIFYFFYKLFKKLREKLQ